MMSTNPNQEREEIRDGMMDVLMQSVPLLRMAIVAQSNSSPIPPDALTGLAHLHVRFFDYAVRAAVLSGDPLPTLPSWLNSPTLEQTVDFAFPQTGVAKALFEALFEIANRLQVLENKTAITRAQLRAWLISKAG